MIENLHAKKPATAALLAACLVAMLLGGCASATDTRYAGVATRTAGTRMGLPVPACDGCASTRSALVEPCVEDCRGLCCRK
ncbi:MAG: hypothetical protein KDH15_16470 [Rhodocyclaceae bacterium]|nr:hypothetical protein [Rhodocyclaceae bacterium]